MNSTESMLIYLIITSVIVIVLVIYLMVQDSKKPTESIDELKSKLLGKKFLNRLGSWVEEGQEMKKLSFLYQEIGTKWFRKRLPGRLTVFSAPEPEQLTFDEDNLRILSGEEEFKFPYNEMDVHRIAFYPSGDFLPGYASVITYGKNSFLIGYRQEIDRFFRVLPNYKDYARTTAIIIYGLLFAGAVVFIWLAGVL